MIRVVKPAAPAVLLEDGAKAAKQHCDEHDSSPADFRSGTRIFQFARSIYAPGEVKTALIAAQRKKCAFCESTPLHVSYGDVEHFRPKAGYKNHDDKALRRPGYYWLTYSWDNLFFCCQLCNQAFKRNLFPLKDGRSRARSHKYNVEKESPLLLDPSRVDPEKYITFEQEVAIAVGGCIEGVTTIHVLGLNRSELLDERSRYLRTLRLLVRTRALLAEKLHATPDQDIEEHLSQVESQIQETQHPTSIYSSMARAFFR